MRDHHSGMPLPDIFARETQASSPRASMLRPPGIATVGALYQPGIMFLVGAGLVAIGPWITRSPGGFDIWPGFQSMLDRIGIWGGLIFVAVALASILRTTLTLKTGREELRKDAERRQRIYHRLRYTKTEDGKELVFDPVTGKYTKPTYVGIQTLVQNLRNLEQ